MNRILGLCMLFILPLCLKAQNKDCKFIEVKDLKGNPIQVVSSPAKLGNFTIGRSDGKLFATYSPKGIFALAFADEKNQINLRIDSVQFIFVDNSLVTLKANGTGMLTNTNNQIKPVFSTINFSVNMDGKNEKLFREAKLIGFRVIAEKEAQFTDALNEKQQGKLLQAFTCIP